MAPAPRYRINEPKITHQTLDGEVVIINFDSGCYYSLGGAGGDIWQGLQGGAGEEQLLGTLVSRYDVEPARASSCLAGLLQQLRDENIIVEADGLAAPPPAGSSTAGEPKTAFVEPELRRYDDMQELLLLDPIHEVDEQGWPDIESGRR